MLESCARSWECAEKSRRMSPPLETLRAHRERPPDSEWDGIAAAHVCCQRCHRCYLATSWQHRVRDLHSPRPRCAWLEPFLPRMRREKKFTQAEQVRVANGRNEGEQLQRPVSTCVGPMRRRTPLFSSTLLGLHPLGNPAQVGVAYEIARVSNPRVDLDFLCVPFLRNLPFSCNYI